MLSEMPFADHLARPRGRGHTPAEARTGAAGGAACGDLIRISLALDPAGPDGVIRDAGFDASGCGAALAAGSATVQLVRGRPLLEAARIGAQEIAGELGGLLPAKRHAAELAADALHRALGAAVRDQAGLAAEPRRTLVAMSGGVDSAVAALLTARAGEEVVGVTLELWADPENDGERSCCSAQAVRGARELAHRQGFPHLSIDLRAEFRAGVVDHWLADQQAGLTPNPCLRCNGNVRLDAMLELADRLGCARLVTGHYARLHDDAEPRDDTAGRDGADPHPEDRRAGAGRPVAAAPAVDGPDPLLRTARDEGKDQSYVLAALAPASLARLRFPLGEMTKPEVRELAAQAGLRVARKPDSQDLCFLAGTGLARFLERHGTPAADDADAAGDIVDRSGRRLGGHDGAQTFTIGQRRGLRVGGAEALYVLGTDPRARTVTVGPREALLTDAVAIRDVTLRRPGARVDGVKVRSHGALHPCRVAADAPAGRHQTLRLQMQEPIVRAAPGQVACLYQRDVILGYGIVSA